MAKLSSSQVLLPCESSVERCWQAGGVISTSFKPGAHQNPLLLI